MHWQAFQGIQQGRAQVGLPCPFLPADQQPGPLHLLRRGELKERSASRLKAKLICTAMHCLFGQFKTVRIVVQHSSSA